MENKLVYSVVLSSKAQKQLLESFDWYELQSSQLGDRFVESVLDRIYKIQQNPELFSVRYKSYREVKIANFPFVIIYEVIKKRKVIMILSIFHTSQNPQIKYKR